MPTLMSSAREAAAELGNRTRLPPDRVVLGGRSMGGRVCSMLVSDDDALPALGLLLLGYPLHPAGRPEARRVEHFGGIEIPTLFVSGTRDALAGRRGLVNAARRIPGDVQFHWLDGADHGYRPSKATGRTYDDVLDEVARVTVDWVLDL
jgi:predicted alpha/beta-hydrolase family hydrolase